MMKRDELIYAAISVPLMTLWLLLLFADPRLGVDFYPLYFAGQRLGLGLSPYGDDATRQLAQGWHAPFATAGIAYPLPLLLLMVPLALVPLAYATGTWISAGVIGVLAALRLRQGWPALLCIALLFLPFYRGAVMGQATLIWFGLSALLVMAIQSERLGVVGVVCALLLLKPQNGLLFGLAGIAWACAGHRRALWWFFGASLALWGGAFFAQPGWLNAWLAQVQTYQAIVRPPSLLPWGLAAIAATWKLPWWARVAAAQVIAFPLSDLYSGLPLLFCWLAIGGPAALAGASVSWLWSLLGLPKTVAIFWLVVMLPLLVAAVWRGWIWPAGKTRGYRLAAQRPQ